MFTSNDAPVMTPSELVAALDCAIEANLAPFIWGDSGIGKSNVIQQYGAATNRELRDLRAVQLDPVDLRGLPAVKDDVTRWLPPAFLPTSGRGILFLDELPAAPAMVQAAMYELVLDRRIGQEYSLPEEWVVVAAGNPASVKGVHFAMPYPLRSRFAHFTLVPDVDEWCKWALKKNIHPLVIAYHRSKRDALHRPPTQDVNAWPSPRTWEMASRAYTSAVGKGMPEPAIYKLLAGIIGVSAASEFLAFVGLTSELPPIEAILLNPDTAPLPTRPDTRIAVATALGRMIRPHNIAQAVTYLKRMAAVNDEPEYIAVAIRDAAARDERITLTHEFSEFAIDFQGVLV